MSLPMKNTNSAPNQISSRPTYLGTTVDIRMPLFGSAALIDYLKSLSWGAHAEVSEAPHMVRRGKRLVRNYDVNHRTLRLTFGAYASNNGTVIKFLRNLEEIFRPGYLTVTSVPHYDYVDDWELLESTLAAVDWTADMSDDHRYWAALQATKRLVAELVAELNPLDPKRLRDMVQTAMDKSNGWGGWLKVYL